METTIINQNNAYLKKGRRWLLAYVICVITLSFLSVLSSFRIQVNILSLTVLIVSYTLSLFSLLMAFLSLRKHTSPHIRMFGTLFIITFAVSSLLGHSREIPMGYLPIWVTFFLCIVPNLVKGILLCMACACLLRNENIREYYRQPVGMLAILGFLISILGVTGYFFHDLILLRTYVQFSDILRLLIYIGMFMAIKSAFSTPHALSEEETEASITRGALLRPGRIEVGFAVATTLAVVLTIVSVRLFSDM